MSDFRILITKAITGNDDDKREFARRIPEILSELSTDVVRDQFIPFMRAWMPYGNQPALILIARAIPAIIEAIKDCKLATAVIEPLVCAEDPKVFSEASASLKSYHGDLNLDDLISELAKSRYDSVRAFTVDTVHLMSDENAQTELWKSLARDPSFCVKYSVASKVKDMKDELAQVLCAILLTDEHSRIRALLAHTLCGKEWFIDYVTTKMEEPLAKDRDWSVRATFCSALQTSADVKKAAEICGESIEDPVWLVGFSGVKSLTSILRAHPELDYSVPSSLLSLLGLPRIPLKEAVIDCFFVRKCLTDEEVVNLVGIVAAQPSEVKLHFLEAISSRPQFVKAVSDSILPIVQELCLVKGWRIRLGVVSVLDKIETVVEDENLSKEFSSLVMHMTKDEAFAVREAASRYLALKYLKDGADGVMKVVEFGRTSFRERQIIISILSTMQKFTSDESLKELINRELEKFKEDPVSNVAYTARIALVEEPR